MNIIIHNTDGYKKTGLLLTKTVRGNARSLGKVDGNKLLSVVLEGLKNSPQFKMPFLKRGAFLTSILENKDSMDTLRRLVCLFAEEYSQLFLEGKRVSASVRYCSCPCSPRCLSAEKAPRFRNGILNCGEFFRPSRTTDNNLLPSTFPSDRARYRAQFW